jgi:hypothetical protein
MELAQENTQLSEYCRNLVPIDWESMPVFKENEQPTEDGYEDLDGE